MESELSRYRRYLLGKRKIQEIVLRSKVKTEKRKSSLFSPPSNSMGPDRKNDQEHWKPAVLEMHILWREHTI